MNAPLRRLVVLLAAIACWWLAGPCLADAAVSPVTVTFRTSDGVQITGSLYAPSRRPAPCVILVHMLGRSREDWHTVGSRLADAGICALAIDLRGHGASADSAAAPDSDNLSPALLDVQAARAFLAARSDLAVSSIGVAGASVGANLAAVAAAADPSIRSIALLSPGLDFRGLRAEAALRKFGDRPALFVSSQEDGYSTRSIRRLAKAGNGTRDVRLFSGAGHGTVMLSRQPELVTALVEWFTRTL